MAGSAIDPPGVSPRPATGRPPFVRRRTFEIGTAVTVAAFGVLISSASLAHDIAWTAAGPGAGYFPFRVGVLLVLAGAASVFQSRGVRTDAVFATRQELRRTLDVFWPTAALAAATLVLGSYVPSGLFLAWMMRRHGGYGWLPSAAFGAAAVCAFYTVFDLWFRVPLAKGPVEAALGLY